MVTLDVSFEVVILSKSLATNLTGEPIFGLLSAVTNLVDPQFLFPSESFTTGRTLVRSLACVRHLVCLTNSNIEGSLHNILQDIDDVYKSSVSAIKIYASSFQTKALANLPYMRMHVLPFIT